MTDRQPVRDFYKRIIGWIDTDSVTGDQVGRDFYMRIVGYYDAKLNVTRDFYKRIVNYLYFFVYLDTVICGRLECLTT